MMLKKKQKKDKRRHIEKKGITFMGEDILGDNEEVETNSMQ